VEVGNRESGGPGDSGLDRELARALNVDPSPEFLARVRMRVASEPAPSTWRRRWMVLAGAAAAVVLMAVVMTLWPGADRVSPQQAALPDATTAPERQAAPASPSGVSVEPASRPTPPSVPVRAQVARVTGTPTATAPAVPVAAQSPRELPPFPEVVISADEVRAYQRLLGIVDQQRLPPTPPPARADTGAVDLHDIDLASLKIEALPPMARLEGVRP
jgi:hypothetical protein